MTRVTIRLALPDMSREQLLGYTNWGDELSLRALRTLIRDSASGSASVGPGGRLLRVAIGLGRPSRAVTITTNPAANSQYVPANTNLIFTAVAGAPANNRQFQIGATTADTAANYAAAVNAFWQESSGAPAMISAAAVGNVVTFTAALAGSSIQSTGPSTVPTGSAFGPTLYDGLPLGTFYQNGVRAV